LRALFETPAEPLSRRRRLLVLAICCMSLLIVGLDATIVNVALPAIHRSLHASVSGLQWTLDAYTLVMASLLMLGGSTADRIGRRRVFQIGLSVFSLASLLCGLSTSLDMLIAARALQGIGGAMLNPVAMAIIRNVFEDPKERAAAIGVWGGVFGLSMALGPVLGGALVDSVGWQAVFYVNVPVGLAAILLTARFVPESRAPHSRRMDPGGQLLVIIALATLTYAIIEGPQHGWTSVEIVALFASSALAFVALVFYELRRREPLLEMRFFRSVPFAGASATAILAFAGFNGYLFLNTLYLQSVRGLSPLDAGLYLIPTASMLLIFSPLTGRLMGRRGSRQPTVVGAVAMIAGAAMLLSLSTSTSYAYLLVSYFLFGIGIGMINPPITNTAVSGMPGAQAGVAAAVASTSRVVGVTLGIAVIGAVSGGSLGSKIGPSFADATHPGWAIIVGLGAAILILGVLTTGRWASETARRTAERFQTASPAAEAT
jgi:EmrB/QacA subfamily drug resistance transporter